MTRNNVIDNVPLMCNQYAYKRLIDYTKPHVNLSMAFKRQHFLNISRFRSD